MLEMKGAMLNAMRVLNGTVDESKQGVILATTDVSAGVDVRTALTDEDSTGGHGLTGKTLAAQTLTTGVAAVTRRAKTFFVCHVYYLLSYSSRARLLGRGSLSGCLGGGSGLAGARRGLDLGDLQTGKLLTMTLEATIALTLVELEDELLLALELLDDLSSDLSLRKLGRIGNDLLAVVEEDNREGDLGANLAVDLLDVQNIIGGDLILLAASCNDCVHYFALHASVSATAEYSNRCVCTRQRIERKNSLLIHKDGTCVAATGLDGTSNTSSTGLSVAFSSSIC